MLLTAGSIFAIRLSCAVLWMVAYLLIIKRGFQDRALGMPLTALTCNLAIEFTFGVLLRDRPPGNESLIYLIWLALDLVILAQAICFGPARYARTLPRPGFYGVLVLALGTALGIVVAITYAFDDRDGTYSALPANLLMSVLFVAMALRQSDAGGQSIYIAYSKMLGTLAGSIVAVVAAPGSPLLLLGVPTLCFDLTYIVLLHAKLRTLGLNPWTRW
jgi:hypothetical protein